MVKKTSNFGPEIFFNFEDAGNWVFTIIDDLEEGEAVKSVEIKLMSSGAYRAGVIIENDQLDLFGEC